MLFADLPRIRLDKVDRTKVLQYWEAPPTVQEEPEDGTGESSNATIASGNIQLNMTLQNMQGKNMLKLFAITHISIDNNLIKLLC